MSNQTVTEYIVRIEHENSEAGRAYRDQLINHILSQWEYFREDHHEEMEDPNQYADITCFNEKE